MTLGKGADVDGVQPGGSQHPGQAGGAKPGAKIAAAALQAQIGGRPAVADHPIVISNRS